VDGRDKPAMAASEHTIVSKLRTRSWHCQAEAINWTAGMNRAAPQGSRRA